MNSYIGFLNSSLKGKMKWRTVKLFFIFCFRGSIIRVTIWTIQPQNGENMNSLHEDEIYWFKWKRVYYHISHLPNNGRAKQLLIKGYSKFLFSILPSISQGVKVCYDDLYWVLQASLSRCQSWDINLKPHTRLVSSWWSHSLYYPQKVHETKSLIFFTFYRALLILIFNPRSCYY